MPSTFNLKLAASGVVPPSLEVHVKPTLPSGFTDGLFIDNTIIRKIGTRKTPRTTTKFFFPPHPRTTAQAQRIINGFTSHTQTPSKPDFVDLGLSSGAVLPWGLTNVQTLQTYVNHFSEIS